MRKTDREEESGKRIDEGSVDDPQAERSKSKKREKENKRGKDERRRRKRGGGAGGNLPLMT